MAPRLFSLPREERSTVAAILPCSASLGVRFPIGLNGVLLQALVALPLLLAMLPTKMFFDAGEVTESSRRIMVNATGFRAYIDPLLRLFPCSLPELPRQVMPSTVKLEVLVSLKPLIADLTHESVRRH